jgi:hypothetical protein
MGLSQSKSTLSQIGIVNHSCVLQGPFTEIIMSTTYKPVLNIKGQFNFFIDTSKRHWYIMTQLQLDNSQFPYVSFEATTESIPTSDRLIPTMRVVEAEEVEAEKHAHDMQALNHEVIRHSRPLPQQLSDAASEACSNIGAAGQMAIASAVGALDRHYGSMLMQRFMWVGGRQLKYVGTKEVTMNELCRKADKIIVGMGRYNLFNRNCQHFCNNLLCEIGLESAQEKTFGPQTTLTPEEESCDITASVMSEFNPPTTVGQWSVN